MTLANGQRMLIALFCVFVFAAAGTASAQTVVYRVNCGGGNTTSLDAGPDWSADTTAAPSPYWVSGGNNNSFSTGAAIDMSFVPTNVPMSVIQIERYDLAPGTEMKYVFPVSPGTYEVRLYFAEIFNNACTGGAGFRQFDVSIEGAVHSSMDDIDPAGEFGCNTAFGRTIVVQADSAGDDDAGQVDLDIEFIHQIENPAVKAIEIITSDLPPVPVESQSWGTVKSRF